MTSYNATNRKHIREAEKAAAEFERQRISFLCAAMDTIQGRQFFHDLLSFCQAFVQVPTFEPHRDYTALGQRNVGLRYFAEILTNCPDQYILMMKEANVRDELTSARQHAGSQVPGWNDPGSDPADDTSDEPDLFDLPGRFNE